MRSGFGLKALDFAVGGIPSYNLPKSHRGCNNVCECVGSSMRWDSVNWGGSSDLIRLLLIGIKKACKMAG